MKDIATRKHGINVQSIFSVSSTLKAHHLSYSLARLVIYSTHIENKYCYSDSLHYYLSWTWSDTVSQQARGSR